MYGFQLPGTSISEDVSVKQLVVSLDSLHDIAALFSFLILLTWGQSLAFKQKTWVYVLIIPSGHMLTWTFYLKNFKWSIYFCLSICSPLDHCSGCITNFIIPKLREIENIVNILDTFSKPEHESFLSFNSQIFSSVLTTKIFMLSYYREIPYFFAAVNSVAENCSSILLTLISGLLRNLQ